MIAPIAVAFTVGAVLPTLVVGDVAPSELAGVAIAAHLTAIVLRNHPRSALAALMMGAALLGLARSMSWTRQWERSLEQWSLTAGEPRRLVSVVGVVASTPRVDETAWRDSLAECGALREDVLAPYMRQAPSVRFFLEVEAMEPRPVDALEFPGLLRVAITATGAGCLAGDRVRLTGWLAPLEVPRNPGGFDSVQWGRSRGIAGTLHVESADLVERLPAAAWRLSAIHARWRAEVDGTLREALGAPSAMDATALVAASTTGAAWPGLRAASAPFAACGAQHLVAISGFNFGILAGCVLVIAASLGLSRRTSGIVLLVLALTFVASIESEVSSVRAALMGGVSALALASSRSVRAGTPLALVAVAIAWWDPRSPAEPGFQLSFAAILGLHFGTPPLSRLIRSWTRGFSLGSAIARRAVEPLAAAVAAWLATLPIVFAHFGQCAPLCIPSTLVLTPPFAVMVIASNAALLTMPIATPIGNGCGFVANTSARCVLFIATAIGRLPGANDPGRPVQQVDDDRNWVLRLDMVDVGDGSCHLVRMGDAAVLFDCGSLASANAGSAIVVPALKALGVEQLDAVIISHPNTDHFNALPEVVDAFAVRRVIVTPQFLRWAEHRTCAASVALEAAAQRGASIEPHGRGDNMVFGATSWRVIHPPMDARFADSNDGSFIIRVEAGEFTLLLTGDASREACAAVLEPQITDSLRGIEVMELPHHGSFRPEAAALVERVAPPIVLQSTGPRRLLRDRWNELLAGADRLITARDRACALEWRTTGGVRMGRWNGRRYEWTKTLLTMAAASTLAVGRDEERPPDEDRVSDGPAATLGHLEFECPLSDGNVHHPTWRRARERHAHEFNAALSNNQRAIGPVCQRCGNVQLRRENGEPLGDFIEEPFRPPDLDGRRAKRRVAPRQARCGETRPRQRGGGGLDDRRHQRREWHGAIRGPLHCEHFLDEERQCRVRDCKIDPWHDEGSGWSSFERRAVEDRSVGEPDSCPLARLRL